MTIDEMLKAAGPQTAPLEERRRRNREANACAGAKETPEQRASRQKKNREHMRKKRGGDVQS